MQPHHTNSPTPAQTNNEDRGAHPVNSILPKGTYISHPLALILTQLDADFDTIRDLSYDVVRRAIRDAYQTEGWDNESAERFMTWIYFAYPEIPNSVIAPEFRRMDPADFDAIRQRMMDEVNDRIREMELERLKSMPYQEYLQTEHWQHVRHAALDAADYRCRLCNSSTHLHVHHRSYERRGEERHNDVIALCAACHQHFHDKLKVQK